jgi:protein-S-isoprenylcysteine O-methyltransferase Ste14
MCLNRRRTDLELMEEAGTRQFSFRALLQRLRVPLGFLTAIGFLLGSKPCLWSLLLGAPIAICGAAIRAWASGHLKKNAELTVSGPYAHTRNPLYFGSFLMAVGCAVAGGSIALGVFLTGFFLLIYWPVMRAEAAHMQTLFGDDYRRWASSVPLFIPRPTPFPIANARAFDRRQYLHHREYRAAVGLAVVMLILSLKAASRFLN